MALLVSAQELSKSFPHGNLFKSLSFGISTKERIGLIGPNGAGKSTLLKILAGLEELDAGTLSFQKGLKIAYLAQSPEFTPGSTLFDTLLEGAADKHEWSSMSAAHEWISRFEFSQAGIDDQTPIETLSGGWQKRAALARELMRQPDLLLLDEPTNHLDVESILWLEDFLTQSPMALVTITHDRQFLQKVSNRIFDLDRRNPNGLVIVEGTYSDYLVFKESLLSSQQKLEDKLKNTLRREAEWLARGPQARTTKQNARIERAYELQDQVEDVKARNVSRKVNLEFKAVEGGPKKLIEAKGLGKKFDGRELFEDLDLLITAKTRVGLLGRNGCGKSTLIKILLGYEPATSGTVNRADHVKVNYFQQDREALDPELTVLKTVCPQGEYVKFGGNFVHVHGYLERFLFRSERAQAKVGLLSGGEKSRLLLARLMLSEANLLVLDEPTNDLDLSTLHVLEESLDEFPGAIILVSHDRYFMDRICNEILAFSPKGIERFSSVSQWESYYRANDINGDGVKLISSARGSVATQNVVTKSKKLSYKDQRDLDNIEENIQKAEGRVEELSGQMSQADVLNNPAKLREVGAELTKAQGAVEKLYARWQELLEMQKG